MQNLIYINNVLINLNKFVGFEFDDEYNQIWAYLPYLDGSGTALTYTTFTPATPSEFEAIKAYIQSFLIGIEVPKGDEGVEGEAGIEEVVKAPITAPYFLESKPKLPLRKPPIPAIKAPPVQVAQAPAAGPTRPSGAPAFSKKAKLKTPFKSAKNFGGPFKIQ